MNYLIKKTAENNLIDNDEENINNILELISINDIQKNIEYLKNKNYKK